jgi:hypothetical protein
MYKTVDSRQSQSDIKRGFQTGQYDKEELEKAGKNSDTLVCMTGRKTVMDLNRKR